MTPNWVGAVGYLRVGRLCREDLDRLDRWAKASCMRSKKAKYQVVTLHHNNSMQHDRLGEE